MSLGTDHGSVVVGIDGSAASQAALEWAVLDARVRAVPLRIVSVAACCPASTSDSEAPPLGVPSPSHAASLPNPQAVL